DLLPVNGSKIDEDATAGIAPILGVRNTCLHTDDVLKVGGGAVVGLTTPMTDYQGQGGNPSTKYHASIYKDFSSSFPWISLIDGFDLSDVVSRFGSDSKGRLKYYNNVLTKVFNGLCPNAGSPIVPLDVPNIDQGNVLADFMNLRNNPLQSGMAHFHFGLA